MTDDTSGGRKSERDPARVLKLSGDLDLEDLQPLGEKLGRCPPGRPIDLSQITSVDPAALAFLVASLKDAAQGSRSPADLTPSHNPHTCLGPDGVEALLLSEGGNWQTDDRGRLLGWNAFSNERGLQAATAKVASSLSTLSHWTPDSCRTFTTLALELSENVDQHSGRRDGVVALGIDPSEERISLAVADRGMGIRNSLMQNPELAGIDDDLLAIERAMEAGGTAEPGSGGGMGLYFARALMRGNGGKMIVCSGAASLEECEERLRRRYSSEMTGTLILLEANGERPVDSDVVRRRLADLKPTA